MTSTEPGVPMTTAMRAGVYARRPPPKTPLDQLALSVAMREGTRKAHDRAESAGFFERLFKTPASGAKPFRQEDFGHFTLALYYVYQALEEVLDGHASHPAVSGIYFPRELRRAGRLAADVDFLLAGRDITAGAPSADAEEALFAEAGRLAEAALKQTPPANLDALGLKADDWRLSGPTPAAKAYAARLRLIAEKDPARLVAHAYVRYLGDLSGGAQIATRARRLLALQTATTANSDLGAESTQHRRGSPGLRFFAFPAVDHVNSFKESFRAALDAVPLCFDFDPAAALAAEGGPGAPPAGWWVEGEEEDFLAGYGQETGFADGLTADALPATMAPGAAGGCPFAVAAGGRKGVPTADQAAADSPAAGTTAGPSPSDDTPAPRASGCPVTAARELHRRRRLRTLVAEAARAFDLSADLLAEAEARAVEHDARAAVSPTPAAAAATVAAREPPAPRISPAAIAAHHMTKQQQQQSAWPFSTTQAVSLAIAISVLVYAYFVHSADRSAGLILS